MRNKKKILIIENQFTQFKEIIKLLDAEGYQSFPDEKTFKEYLDWIKIFLNPRYTLDRRNKFWDKILAKAIGYEPDIFIIDHILLGMHDAQNGIDLAIKFRESGIKQPFIFFSRTEMNNIDVCEKLPKVLLEKVWIFKGYSGADILEKLFFTSEVIPKIEAFLKKSIFNRVIEKLNGNIIDARSSTTEIHEAIKSNTEKVIGLINNGQLIISEDLYTQINNELSKADYNELLKKICNHD